MVSRDTDEVVIDGQMQVRDRKIPWLVPQMKAFGRYVLYET